MATNNKQKLKLSTLGDNLYTEIPNFHEKWSRVVKNYPKHGKVGFSHSHHYSYSVRYAEYILFRNDEGEMVGMITFYLHDYFQLAKAGEFMISVDPNYWRKGIGSKLLKEAIKKWNIDFNKQIYTSSGIKLLMAFINTAEAKSYLKVVF